MERNNVTRFEPYAVRRERLSEDEKQHWLAVAAFWGAIEDDLVIRKDEAHERRAEALRKLGMLQNRHMPDMEREG